MDEENKIKKITLAERGPRLPIGMNDGTSFHQDFSVRDWSMIEEKALAKARKDSPGQSLAHYVGTVVGFMCPLLGHHSFEPKSASEKDMAERRVHISQMYMSDVWYAYVWIRREALGDDLRLQIVCPRCKEEIPWKGSLSSVEVAVPDNFDDCIWEYNLHKPLEIRGKTVEKFRLGPQIWEMIEKVYRDPDNAIAKEQAILSSVYHLNDESERVRLTSKDIVRLTKRDIEALCSDIDEHVVGPVMAIELGEDEECAKCGFAKKRLIPIDWSFDNFFGYSSH